MGGDALARNAAGSVGGVDKSGGAMNYTRRWMLPLAFYALMLAVCGTPHGVLGTLGTLSPPPDPDQAAEIIVIRPYRYVGSGQGRGIWLDGVLLYGISRDEYVVIQVAPGHHIVG